MYVPIFPDLDAHGGRKLRTDTHTRDNYSNPRCAHACRGLIIRFKHFVKFISTGFSIFHFVTGNNTFPVHHAMTTYTQIQVPV